MDSQIHPFQRNCFTNIVQLLLLKQIKCHCCSGLQQKPHTDYRTSRSTELNTGVRWYTTVPLLYMFIIHSGDQWMRVRKARVLYSTAKRMSHRMTVLANCVSIFLWQRLLINTLDGATFRKERAAKSNDLDEPGWCGKTMQDSHFVAENIRLLIQWAMDARSKTWF